ncbi:hypothetical protein VR45_30765 [Streptomyces sp. NRRL S-495]|nr:hypothetical protein [Streptomyces sp. NRRL S-495]KJY29137.1 hypothetical protein VR45_30765 [Streptomyces sp. NRRL S-495]
MRGSSGTGTTAAGASPSGSKAFSAAVSDQPSVSGAPGTATAYPTSSRRPGATSTSATAASRIPGRARSRASARAARDTVLATVADIRTSVGPTTPAARPMNSSVPSAVNRPRSPVSNTRPSLSCAECTNRRAVSSGRPG